MKKVLMFIFVSILSVYCISAQNADTFVIKCTSVCSVRYTSSEDNFSDWADLSEPVIITANFKNKLLKIDNKKGDSFALLSLLKQDRVETETDVYDQFIFKAVDKDGKYVLISLAVYTTNTIVTAIVYEDIAYKYLGKLLDFDNNSAPGVESSLQKKI